MTIDGTPIRYTNSLNGLSTFYFDGNESLKSSDQDQVASNGNHWAIGVFRWDSVDNSKDSFWSFDNTNTSRRTYAAVVQEQVLGLVKLITMVTTLLYQGLLKILSQQLYMILLYHYLGGF